MRENTNQACSREHRRPPKPFQKLQFADTVDVLCTNAAKKTCAIAHCLHGHVQYTIDQLRTRVNLECAPLSIPTAVLSSKGDENEDDHFASMQKPPRIVQFNEMEAPPWNLHHFAGGIDAEDESSTESEPDAPQGQDDDPGDSGDTPPDEPNFQPPEHDHNRQSVLLYHLDDIPIHTMLNWVDFHTMMREVAHHFAMDRADLLDCHDMTTQPNDIPDGTVPLIVQFARDIAVGEPSVLVMLDVVVHGQEQEAHFQTAPRVRRHVIPVPVWLVRQTLLIQIQLFEYCRFEHNRCLIKHEGMTWPLQEVLPRRMRHGNYLQVVVPPPQYCELPTRDMIEASRNMEVEAFWSQYYVPTPSEVIEESAESETDVSPSLMDSDDIRDEFGRNDEREADVAGLMQRPNQANQSASSSEIANTTQQIVNDSCIMNFNPNVPPWPVWFRSLGLFFENGAWIERDDEGPVAFLTTWYADCSIESVSEVSRVVRLDTQMNLWVQDIQHAWQDKIQRDVPVHFAWVYPRPLATPTEHTIGHLIVYQRPNEIRAPILLNFQFRALNLDGTAHAVAVVPHGLTPEELARRANLDRVCRGRRCTVHRGAIPRRRWYDPFRTAEGIKIVIPSPGERADDELHWGMDSVLLIDLGPLAQPLLTLSMRIEDQSSFIQRLHPIWLQQGQRTAITDERILEVHTWYVDGVYVPYNDQQRNVLLGGDFTEWEQELRRVWHDLEDAGEEMGFALVHPIPSCSPLNAVHILLYQQLNYEQVGLVVTKYDNAVRQGAPYSTAIVCTNPVKKERVLEVLGKSDDCARSGVQCTLWIEQREIHEMSQLGLETGRNLQLHIYRHSLPSWTADEDEVDEQVLLQQRPHHSLHALPVLNEMAVEFTIADMPEHLQDLHDLWSRTASVPKKGGERTSSVQTWYLSPGMNRLNCGYCRKVYLPEDFVQWEHLMIQAWQDVIAPAKPVFFHVVQPNPVALEHDVSAHILLTQEPTEKQVTSLITLFDDALHDGHPFRIAIVTHEHITREEVIERVGYSEEFRRFGDTIRCTLQHASFTSPIGTAVPGNDGDHIVIVIKRDRIEQEWNPPFLPVQPGMEGVQPLQRSTILRQSKTNDEHVEDGTAQIQIEMKPAIDAFEWIDTHFLLLSFLLPPAVCIPFESLSWIELPLWEVDKGGQEIWIYFDGSFQSDAAFAGIAVAVFIKSDQQWFQAGMLSAQVPPTGSYTAELHASIIAAKIAHDTLKMFACNHLAMPEIWFCYDSQTVGNQLLGQWKCMQHPLLGRSARMLIELVEARFSITCKGWHIRSHRGEPGNELVDGLAHFAAHGHVTHDLAHFFQQILCKNFIAAGEWMWLLFEREYEDRWEGTRILLPGKSRTQPHPSILQQACPFEEDNCDSTGRLQLVLATGNVLTLKGSDQSKHESLAGPTRQTTILKQLHEAGVGIFALQETRLRKVHTAQDSNFLLFSSPATAAGHYGIVIGFSTQHPHGWISDAPKGESGIVFQPKHFSLVARDPRYLIVRVRSPVLRCLVIAAHAPHTGATEKDIEAWWSQVDANIPQKYATWDKILLADANARVGTYPSLHVGPWQAETDSEKSEYFLRFLQKHELWLPATFEAYQKGEGGTWRHNQGKWLRNDYIALPTTWHCHSLQAYVSDQIDLSTVKEDHAVAIVELTTDIIPLAKPRKHLSHKRHEQDLDRAPHLAFLQPPHISWDIDVHTHAQMLQTQLLKQIPGRKRIWSPLKTTMSDATWNLVKEKKMWRNQMWESTRVQKMMWMRLCFNVWAQPDAAVNVDEVRTIQKYQDHLCATAFASFRRLGRQVVAACRRDDSTFFDRLAHQASELTNPQQAREFWTVIRRSLPKMRTRKSQIPPMQLEHLEEQWHPYFQDLEVGVSTTPAELIQECFAYQSMQPCDTTVCELDSLPSRAQIISAFRDTQPHKATGLDPLPSGLLHKFPVQMARFCWDLFMKIFIWQKEPIQAKGGILAVIPKKNDQSRAAHFRGIMLLPTIFKRLHALLRAQVIEVIAPLKPAGQIGGFGGQQVQFGSMSLQCFSRLAQQHNLSLGVVFVDLANAFHRLIRELVCGIARNEDVDALLHSLESSGGSSMGVQKWLEFPCLLQRLGAPPKLVNLLQDVHAHTWHVLSAHPGMTRTRRGTRPGSPLADVVFHVAMLDITIELNDWVSQQQQYQNLLHQLDVHMETIVWSDDLAIPWLTVHADEMPGAIETLLQQIYKVFNRRGFDLNMQKGKTTAVVTFRGSGAPEMRRQYQLAAATGLMCNLTPSKAEWLHFAPAYKHLGTYFAADGGFQVEMRHRIGQAHTAFTQLSRPVLCNRHIDVKTRIRLFHALVGTKLFFGLGAWPTPHPRQIEKLNAVLTRCLRKILGLAHHQDSSHTTNAQIFAIAQCLDARARIAQDRLLLAQKLFQHGPAFLHHMIHREYSVVSNSWLHGVFADLVWLHKLDAAAVPETSTKDLTALIEHWQQGGPGWKALIKRLSRRHIFQEAMMTEVHGWHRKIFQTIEKAGGVLTPKPQELNHEFGHADHQCSCGRAFTTAVGLATHMRQTHKIFSMEHDLLEGATCPACMKHFWSTQRLQQHLAYISRRTGRNECFQALMSAGFKADYHHVAMPSALLGLNRANWIQAHGPQPQYRDQRTVEIVKCEEEIQLIEQRIAKADDPCQGEQTRQQFYAKLNACTSQWLKDFQEAGFDADAIVGLSERWMEVITSTLEHHMAQPDQDQAPQFDTWLEQCFLQWGQADLGDLIAGFEDGEAEYIADDAFAEFAQDLPSTAERTRLNFLRQKIQALLAQGPDHPHRAVKTPASHRHSAVDGHVTMKFEEQTAWHERLRALEWDQCLPSQPIPRLLHGGKPHFVVVHLFSGRRRPQDVHYWLAQWANHRGAKITVLSMDTAVSQAYGNLHVKATSWQKLVTLYECGAIAATLAGAPCETFSAARHLPPPEHIEYARWPRPLRSASRLFGLAMLTAKELRQCRQGTEFSLQTLFIAVLHLASGGVFLSEHPACPEDEEKASIWRSALVELLRKDPDCKLQTFAQWRWGSATPKPTGLLSIRLPSLAKSMYACADQTLTYPAKIAQGVDEQGRFNTAACKEYPPLFCRALAKAFTDQFEASMRSSQVINCTVDDLSLHQWLHEAAVESSPIYDFTTYRPDFQGR